MKCTSCGTNNEGNARFCAECGKPLAKSEPDFSTLQTMDSAETRNPKDAGQASLQPGAVFAGRFTIRATIGQGGMGVVYRAMDQVVEKDVALKLIRADRLAGRDAVKRLIREGVTSRDIRHPNVVAVYDVGEAGEQPYISMELLEGRSLRTWNRARMQAGTDCAMRAAANIVRELLAGLDAAHKAGVIHRDLKPENVMLLTEPSDESVRLKILDFGIARAGGLIDTGSSSLGTREYMAPEQLTAPDAVQPSADIYSLSVLFYELLVGVVPQGSWQPPSGGRSDVPPGIDRLIERGMSNSPKQRPQSAAEYLALLDDAMKTAGPKPPPRPPTPPPAPPNPPPVDVTKTKIKLPKNWWAIPAALVGLIAIWQGVSQMASKPAAPPQSSDSKYDKTLDTIASIAKSQNLPIPPNIPLPTPRPQPPHRLFTINNYTTFSGFWMNDDGDNWSVNAFPSGLVNGIGTSGQSQGMSFRGNFLGSVFTWQVFNGYGQPIGVATGQFDGGCHINYAGVAPNGNTYPAQIHINHQPGANCP